MLPLWLCLLAITADLVSTLVAWHRGFEDLWTTREIPLYARVATYILCAIMGAVYYSRIVEIKLDYQYAWAITGAFAGIVALFNVLKILGLWPKSWPR